MSVVAVKVDKNKIVIGADSIRVSGTTQEKDKHAKLKKINDMVIGSVGYSSEFSLLLLFCKSRKPKSADEDDILEFFSEFISWLYRKTGQKNYSFQNTYIFIFQEKVFLFDDYYIEKIEDYESIGAGRDFALAALYCGLDVPKAIHVACELSIYCEEPINIIELIKNGKTRLKDIK